MKRFIRLFEQLNPREYMQVPEYHSIFEALGLTKDIK